MLSGFTLVHNAVKLDFPIVAAIQSLLEACDEVVVNVGASDDGTRDLVTGVDDPRVRIIDRKWEFGIGDEMLAVETQRAMDACRGSWGISMQADEVLRERQENGGALAWIPLLQPYRGQHPAVAREWIAKRSHHPLVGPQHFKLEHLRFYFSDWIERLTGARVFEFRNYQVV